MKKHDNDDAESDDHSGPGLYYCIFQKFYNISEMKYQDVRIENFSFIGNLGFFLKFLYFSIELPPL